MDLNVKILVAKTNDVIIGSVTVLKIDLFTFGFQPMLELFNVCVHSNYRKNGIGSLLLDFVKDYAKENGYRSISLTCLEDVPIVHKFYEEAGFSKANSRKYTLAIT